ncbi:phenoloxidase-activating enzyme-like [Papilio machaon]|uniref:phenoloxidase-activating enzyme-like n=1 Tax=Papilio machaon TaxID=76193 RepID=UPI001E662F17|nr:phenoloxidase-activating enzyme-like [Papilio machaon]
MQFQFTCFVLVFYLTEFINADKQCRMPNGNAGECKTMKKCKPLYELNKKRVKTDNELLYLRQSLCTVTSGFNAVFCCPPESQWSDFNGIKPVLYDEIKMYDTVLKEKPVTISDNGIDLDTRGSKDDRDPPNNRNQDNISKVPPIQDDDTECGKDVSNDNRIIGGGPAGIDQYPWLVLLEYAKGLTLCGGSLITSRFVLTAAHCLRAENLPLFARLAEYNTSSYPTDTVETDGGGFDNITVEIVPIERSIRHPNYTRAYLHHDIGLSKLKRAVTFTEFIRTICLPTQDYRKTFTVPLNFTVAGWGSDGSKFSEVKKHVKVPYVPNDQCRERYTLNKIVDSQMCAGGKRGEDSCSGDSGGPLMYELEDNTYVAIGVVSFGYKECGTVNVPAIYTYVYEYLDWIKDNMV